MFPPIHSFSSNLNSQIREWKNILKLFFSFFSISFYSLLPNDPLWMCVSQKKKKKGKKKIPLITKDKVIRLIKAIDGKGCVRRK